MEMFPDRFWIAVGTGQFLSEHITKDRWPNKAERNARLAEAAGIIKDLYLGKIVSSDGYIPTDRACIYSLPPRPPPLVAAALSPSTAAFVAKFADGLITVNLPKEDLAAVIDAFRKNGGAGKPLYLQVHLSYANTEEQAMKNAMDQWGSNCVPASVGETLDLWQLDQMAQVVTGTKSF